MIFRFLFDDIFNRAIIIENGMKNTIFHKGVQGSVNGRPVALNSQFILDIFF